MGKQPAFIIIAFLLSFYFAQSQDLTTWFETSNFKETPRYEQTISYCKLLDSISDKIQFTIFGNSAQGRTLPLLIFDNNGETDPVKIKNSGKLVLLIQACIHAGEPDGKDAGLMLFRDMAISMANSARLNNICILFIPIFNVDGHERFGKYNRINQNGPVEMGWRVNAQNINLNRDYLKADAPEMQAWLRLFTKWLPDFVIDCHTTDGADYQYVLTYGAETFGNLDPSITQWLNNEFIPGINKRVENEGYPIFPYIAFRNWGDPRSGLRTWASPPRLSMGYVAIQNRPGILIETHMLKDYKTRVFSTLSYLKNSIDLLAGNYQQIIKLNKDADYYCSGSKFRELPFPLKFSSTSDSEIVEFKGVKYNISKSSLTGSDKISYTDTPYTFKLPYFNKQKVVESAKLPIAYIIPGEWHELIRLLHIHGITLKVLTDSVTIKVNTYRFGKPSWQTEPYEGRHPVNKLEKTEIEMWVKYNAGAVVVPMSQRTAKVIAHLIEPGSPDSYLSWGGFDAIFEQKEYAESYVMERIALEMLKTDPALKKEFDDKMLNDKDFSANPEQILNWFYSKSNYWDKSLRIFPIGKIFEQNQFAVLKTR